MNIKKERRDRRSINQGVYGGYPVSPVTVAKKGRGGHVPSPDGFPTNKIRPNFAVQTAKQYYRSYFHTGGATQLSDRTVKPGRLYRDGSRRARVNDEESSSKEELRRDEGWPKRRCRVRQGREIRPPPPPRGIYRAMNVGRSACTSRREESR